jgi:hypothetical protein
MPASHQPSSSFQNITNKLRKEKKKQATTIKLIPSHIRFDMQQFVLRV